MKRLLRKLKRALRVAIGRDITISCDILATTEFHGTSYGGWAIVKDSLSPSSIVYSFGIGEDASFDISLISKYKCNVYAFDPTPKSLQWVSENIENPKFTVRPWAIWSDDGTLRLLYPKNPSFVSASLYNTSVTSDTYFDAEGFSLPTILKKLGHSAVDVLKMDIEGAEYDVIHHLIKSRIIEQIDQILVEFHHWVPEIELDQTRRAIASLKEFGFKIHWVSESGYEVLFRRPQAYG